MPALVRLQEAYGDKGLEVIGLNADEEPVDQINKFAGDMKLNYTLVWADPETQNEFVKISSFLEFRRASLLTAMEIFAACSRVRIREISEKWLRSLVRWSRSDPAHS
jgi:hypothetical protein